MCIRDRYRPFYYTAVSDYATKVFGFETFGTVYGLMICISGICNMGQGLLDKWTHTTFKMNPTPINSILLLVTIFSCGALLAFVTRTLHSENIQNSFEGNTSAGNSDTELTARYDST